MEKQKVKKEPTKYDTLSINDLEGKVEKMFTMSRESQKEMYEVLEYLRTSNRFKENPGYKKAVFWEYLEDRFTIREGTYRENVRAYGKFPDATLKYGVGIVTKITRICGNIQTKKVLEEIAKENVTHKKPLSRASIETIIQKHGLPKIEKVITDWKVMFEDKKREYDKLFIASKEKDILIKELYEQIDKLKKTAEKFMKIEDICKKHYVPIREQQSSVM